MTALALKITPEATTNLQAAREKFRAKAGLSLIFPILWKLLLKMLPWIIEMLIPLVLKHQETTKYDATFPVPEPYLVAD